MTDENVLRQIDLLSDELIAWALKAGLQARIRFVKCPKAAKRIVKRVANKGEK